MSRRLRNGTAAAAASSNAPVAMRTRSKGTVVVRSRSPPLDRDHRVKRHMNEHRTDDDDTTPYFELLPNELLAALLQRYFTPAERRVTIGATCRRLRELVDSLVSVAVFRLLRSVDSRQVAAKLTRLQRLRVCDLSAFCYQNYDAAERVADALQTLPMLDTLTIDPTVVGMRAFPFSRLASSKQVSSTASSSSSPPPPLRTLVLSHAADYDNCSVPVMTNAAERRGIERPLIRSVVNHLDVDSGGDTLSPSSPPQPPSVRSTSTTAILSNALTACSNATHAPHCRIQVRAMLSAFDAEWNAIDDDDEDDEDSDNDGIILSDQTSGDGYDGDGDDADDDDDGGDNEDDDEEYRNDDDANAVDVYYPAGAVTRSGNTRSADLVRFAHIDAAVPRRVHWSAEDPDDSVIERITGGGDRPTRVRNRLFERCADDAVELSSDFTLAELVLHASFEPAAWREVDTDTAAAVFSGLDTDELHALCALRTLRCERYTLALASDVTFFIATLQRVRSLSDVGAPALLRSRYVDVDSHALGCDRKRASDTAVDCPADRLFAALTALALDLRQVDILCGGEYLLWKHMPWHQLREISLVLGPKASYAAEWLCEFLSCVTGASVPFSDECFAMHRHRLRNGERDLPLPSLESLELVGVASSASSSSRRSGSGVGQSVSLDLRLCLGPAPLRRLCIRGCIVPYEFLDVPLATCVRLRELALPCRLFCNVSVMTAPMPKLASSSSSSSSSSLPTAASAAAPTTGVVLAVSSSSATSTTHVVVQHNHSNASIASISVDGAPLAPDTFAFGLITPPASLFKLRRLETLASVLDTDYRMYFSREHVPHTLCVQCDCRDATLYVLFSPTFLRVRRRIVYDSPHRTLIGAALAQLSNLTLPVREARCDALTVRLEQQQQQRQSSSENDTTTLLRPLMELYSEACALYDPRSHFDPLEPVETVGIPPLVTTIRSELHASIDWPRLNIVGALLLADATLLAQLRSLRIPLVLTMPPQDISTLTSNVARSHEHASVAEYYFRRTLAWRVLVPNALTGSAVVGTSHVLEMICAAAWWRLRRLNLVATTPWCRALSSAAAEAGATSLSGMLFTLFLFLEFLCTAHAHHPSARLALRQVYIHCDDYAEAMSNMTHRDSIVSLAERYGVQVCPLTRETSEFDIGDDDDDERLDALALSADAGLGQQ